MEITTLLFVATLNFFLHVFGSISGGKGLILRPLLVFLGIPIQTVITSAIFSGTFTRFIKVYSFQKYKKVDWSLVKIYFVITSIGAIVGAMITVNTNEEIIKNILGLTIILVGVFLLFDKKLGLEEKKKSLNKKQKTMIYPFYFIGHAC